MKNNNVKVSTRGRGREAGRVLAFHLLEGKCRHQKRSWDPSLPLHRHHRHRDRHPLTQLSLPRVIIISERNGEQGSPSACHWLHMAAQADWQQLYLLDRQNRQVLAFVSVVLILEMVKYNP